MAPDGGLYVPESLPAFSREQSLFAGSSYTDLAFNIVQPFVGDCIPADDLKAIIDDTYNSDFRHPSIAPLVQLDQNEWVLELFQGPTLAFKDFALQMLGRLLDYVLERRNQKVVIIGATRAIPVLPLFRAVSAAIISIFLFCILISAYQTYNVVR